MFAHGFNWIKCALIIPHRWSVDRTGRWRSVGRVRSECSCCWRLWATFRNLGRYRWRSWRGGRSPGFSLLGRQCRFKRRGGVSLRRDLSLRRRYRLDLRLRLPPFLNCSIHRYRRRLHCWSHNSMSGPRGGRRAWTGRGLHLRDNVSSNYQKGQRHTAGYERSEATLPGGLTAASLGRTSGWRDRSNDRQHAKAWPPLGLNNCYKQKERSIIQTVYTHNMEKFI